MMHATSFACDVVCVSIAHVHVCISVALTRQSHRSVHTVAHLHYTHSHTSSSTVLYSRLSVMRACCNYVPFWLDLHSLSPCHLRWASWSSTPLSTLAPPYSTARLHCFAPSTHTRHSDPCSCRSRASPFTHSSHRCIYSHTHHCSCRSHVGPFPLSSTSLLPILLLLFFSSLLASWSMSMCVCVACRLCTSAVIACRPPSCADCSRHHAHSHSHTHACMRVRMYTYAYVCVCVVGVLVMIVMVCSQR